MSECNTSSAPDQTDPEDRFWGTYNRGFNTAWTIVIVMAAAAGVLDTWTDNRAAMRGWPLIGLIALLGGYFALYRWFFWSGVSEDSTRRIALYGVAQLAIVLLLSRYNPSFVGLLYAVLAHLIATLPYRAWPIPIAISLLVVYFYWDIHSDVLTGNLDDAFLKLFQPVTWIIVFATITIVARKSYEQTQTLRELRRARAQLEAGAAQAEELAVLRERARLAREFHDNLGHALVLVNVKLEAAQRLYGRDRARGDAELEATRELVRQAMSELRRSLADLRAPVTAHHDLAAALHALASETTAQSSLHVEVEIQPDLPPLEPRAAETLWRVAREALSNIERHAGAASATIGLERRGDTLLLRVVDDGVGISAADRRKAGHYGILGMRERMEALDGGLSVGTGPSGGTVVLATLAVAPSAVPAALTTDTLGAERAQDTAGAKDRQNAAGTADAQDRARAADAQDRARAADAQNAAGAPDTQDRVQAAEA